MADELVGTIVLYVDGQEVDCRAVNPTETVGRKLVATMNSKGRANKSAKTTASGALTIEAYVESAGGIDWASIEDARVTATSEDGSYRETWTGVGVSTVGKQFSVDSEAVQSLECFYKDYIKE